MSTYQPPGGQPPEGTPTYPQPQDPWAAGQDHGLASVPTDPIPQQYDPYAHGTGGAVWSQATVAHGESGYDLPPSPQRRRTGLLVGLFAVVLVLGGGGGFAAWYVTSQTRKPDPQVSNTATASPSANATTPAVFDPHQVEVDDCVANRGTALKPEMVSSACVVGSFTVLKKVEGASIKENADGKFDAETTSAAACAGTGFESWYGYKDALDEKKDVFFCLKNNK